MYFSFLFAAFWFKFQREAPANNTFNMELQQSA